MAKGTLIVLSGFSGAGKGTIVKRLIEKYAYSISISATTRNPRPGEEDGREYFFKTKEEFQDLIANDGLIEWAQYVDNYYGTPRKFVEDELNAGKNVILEIEVQGAMNVKKQYEDAILMFVTTKDAETLASRLRGRGTETEEVIQKRLQRAGTESDLIDNYDYVVVNDELEAAVDTVNAIVVADKCRREANADFIAKIQKELKAL